MVPDFWLSYGKLITPRGILDGAVRISAGRIAAIRSGAPRGARAISARGCYVAPGCIDLHVWGLPEDILHWECSVRNVGKTEQVRR